MEQLLHILLWAWAIIWGGLVCWVFFGDRINRIDPMIPLIGRLARRRTSDPYAVPVYNGKRWRAWVLIAAIFSAFVLASFEYLYRDLYQGLDWESLGASLVVAGYRALQHLLFNGSLEPPPAGSPEWSMWFLHFSSVSAVASYLLIILEAVRRLFTESVQVVELRLYRDHVVVCGLGEVGLLLVKDAVRKRQRVVVVEKYAQNAYAHQVALRGVTVVFGNAKDEQVLKRVNAANARYVFFALPSDEDNLEGAADLCALASRSRSQCSFEERLCRARTGRLGVYLRLRDEPIRHVAEQLMMAAPEGTTFGVFNLAERTGRSLVTELLVPDRPLEETQAAHYVVLGFGPMGQQVLRNLAEFAHYENLKRPRVTVVFNASERRAVVAFARAYPRLMPPRAFVNGFSPDPACDDWSYGVEGDPDGRSAQSGVEFVVNGGWIRDDGGARSPKVLDALIRLASAPDTRPTVILCREDDDQNFTAARQLRDELDQRMSGWASGSSRDNGSYAGRVPVFAYVPHRPLLTGSAVEQPDGITFFGVWESLCTLDALTQDLHAEFAACIAVDYARRHDPESLTGFGATSREKVWYLRSLPVWSQHSSLRAAAFAPVKLAAMGLVDVDVRVANGLWSQLAAGVTAPDNIEGTPAFERAVQMEHNRWMAERLLMGWAFGQEHETARLRRPQLVPWGYVSEAEQQKDREQLRALLALCQSGLA